MRTLFSPNKTSARLLVDFAADTWGKSPSEPLKLRYLMVFDLFIKARSYGILNKVFFWLALGAGIALLVWPVIAFKLDSLGVGYSAIVQTSVTGLAALLFALYSHYKKRQTHTENLMRHVIFSSESLDVLFEKVMKEMERMDQGFVFSETVTKKVVEKSDSEPSGE
ncbi:hypothetical protein [Methylomonas methanica]|uniref:DUF4231 domain-containing protein n=1 Tax=Methylomonas methanica (strain DSM 25384 / MC09) TaxID=857087 RepID=G0A014_METMM|nr:hypothetical protein [Methylomonas methanica]AEG01153.1 hypothetical protein Metme_2771 [Methylomonas methanica MC09]